MSFLDPEKGKSLVQLGQSIYDRRKGQGWYIPNLEFFPDLSPFDEGRFRACASRVDFSNVEGGLDTWVATAKDWEENGF